MNIAQEPLPLFDLGVSHPNICLLLPGSTLRLGPLDVTAQLQPKPYARIPDHVLSTCLRVSGVDFSLVHFQSRIAR